MINLNAQNIHHRVDVSELQINRREILRYLGYRQASADEITDGVIDECLEEELNIISPQGIYSIFPIAINEETCDIDLGFAKVHSKDLTKNLKGCTHIILMAATIGPKLDLVIQRASRFEPVKALIHQCSGAMFIESYCDLLNDKLKAEFSQSGYRLKPRFSPGYGDLDLSLQKDVFKSIRADKTIGLTLMDSLIMAPSKSVTAIIGIAPAGIDCPDYLPGCDKCEVCKKEN